MPNIDQAISKHNSRLKKEEHPQPEPGCNCRGGVDTCPANGQCKKDSVVYRASVTTENGNTEFYTGLTGDTFKTRFGGHKTSFNNQKYRNKTTLSTHIWKLKEEETNFTTRWSLVDRAPIFNPTLTLTRLAYTYKCEYSFYSDSILLMLIFVLSC